MGRSKSLRRVWVLLFCALVFLPWLAHSVQPRHQLVLAADNGFSLPIVAANCQRLPTTFPFEGGDCVPAEGAVIVVTTENGELIGTCTATAEEGSEAKVATCSVNVPFGSTVIVTEDVTVISPEFAPETNAQRWPIPDGPPEGAFGGPVFINLPVANSGAPSDEQGTTTPTPTLQPTYSACTAPPYPTPTLDPDLNLSGYLAIDADGAVFIEWIEVAGELTGTLYWTSPDEENRYGFASDSFSFSGVLSADRLALTFAQGFGFSTAISGQLSDDTLTLFFPEDDGEPVAIVMLPGTLAEYQQAVQALDLAAAQDQECAQEMGATATAIAEQQNAVAGANDRLDRALSSLAESTESLAGETTFDDELTAYDGDLTIMQDDDEVMRADAAVEPFDCYQLGVVEYDLGTIEYDMDTIEYDGSSLQYRIDWVNGYIADVELYIEEVQSAWASLQAADTANSTGSPAPAFTQDDVDEAVNAARQQIETSQGAIEAAQEQADGYEQAASQILKDATEFLAGLTCSD